MTCSMGPYAFFAKHLTGRAAFQGNAFGVRIPSSIANPVNIAKQACSVSDGNCSQERRVSERYFPASEPTRKNAFWGSKRLVRILRTALPLRGNGLREVSSLPREAHQNDGAIVPRALRPGASFLSLARRDRRITYHARRTSRRRCPLSRAAPFFVEHS